MTFSLSVVCPETGLIGMGISSSSPAVAARCCFMRRKSGVVATQNVTDPRLGPQCLDLMENGAGANRAIANIVGATPHIEYRQLVAVSMNGESAAYSGPKSLGVFGDFCQPYAAAAGNLLADTCIPELLVRTFAEVEGRHLGDRILSALRAALDAGGEAGPVHSAGLKIMGTVSWPIADLRIDWDDDDPISALSGLWERYYPQMDDYVSRALNPDTAPSYGVPGDE